MKAARLHEVGKPIKIDDVPKPKIGKRDVLIQIKACGICGSDIHIAIEGSSKVGYLPIILGHEPSGVIAEMGEDVEGWKVGDRVTPSPGIACGKCYNCMKGKGATICVNKKVIGLHIDGALAEYLVMPAENLLRLPDQIDFVKGAVLIDAVATPFHAVNTRANLKLGETIAIIGCGGLGKHAVQIAKLAGAAKIIAVDLVDEILARAVRMGADQAVNAAKQDPVKAIKDLTNGEGVDCSIECVGLAKTIDQAVRCLKLGGRAVAFGLGMEPITLPPPGIYVRSEFSLLGSRGAEIDEKQKVIDLIASGKLDLKETISDVISLKEVNEGLRRLHKQEGYPVRIVVDMDK
jgi:alcohol dehydrogenase, propanol-preferring